MWITVKLNRAGLCFSLYQVWLNLAYLWCLSFWECHTHTHHYCYVKVKLYMWEKRGTKTGERFHFPNPPPSWLDILMSVAGERICSCFFEGSLFSGGPGNMLRYATLANSPFRAFSCLCLRQCTHRALARRQEQQGHRASESKLKLDRDSPRQTRG